jgi:hypothetical protein
MHDDFSTAYLKILPPTDMALVVRRYLYLHTGAGRITTVFNRHAMDSGTTCTRLYDLALKGVSEEEHSSKTGWQGAKAYHAFQNYGIRLKDAYSLQNGIEFLFEITIVISRLITFL